MAVFSEHGSTRLSRLVLVLALAQSACCFLLPPSALVSPALRAASPALNNVASSHAIALAPKVSLRSAVRPGMLSTLYVCVASASKIVSDSCASSLAHRLVHRVQCPLSTGNTYPLMPEGRTSFEYSLNPQAQVRCRWVSWMPFLPRFTSRKSRCEIVAILQVCRHAQWLVCEQMLTRRVCLHACRYTRRLLCSAIRGVRRQSLAGCPTSLMRQTRRLVSRARGTHTRGGDSLSLSATHKQTGGERHRGKDRGRHSRSLFPSGGK